MDNKAILIGIGNSARRDDGLGWAFLDKVKEHPYFKGDIIYRYQLQVEDADLIKDYDTVLFVDAMKNDQDIAFEWKECNPTKDLGFSTHALDPESVVSLCKLLYNKSPKAFVFGIKGVRWELEEGLSAVGVKNLEKGIKYFFNQVEILQ